MAGERVLPIYFAHGKGGVTYVGQRSWRARLVMRFTDSGFSWETYPMMVRRMAFRVFMVDSAMRWSLVKLVEVYSNWRDGIEGV